jgi:hypothetical protein
VASKLFNDAFDAYLKLINQVLARSDPPPQSYKFFAKMRAKGKDEGKRMRDKFFERIRAKG